MAVRESTKPADYAPEPATQRNRGRDESQLDIDKRTRELVAAWDTASHPANGAGPSTRFDVDDKTEGKRMVGRAFSLVSKERREHKDGDKAAPILPSNVRAYWYKDSEPDSDGWITIQYGVAEVTKAQEAAAAAAGTDAPASATADAAASTDAADQESGTGEGGRGFRRGR